jgi:hypothetical protein
MLFSLLNRYSHHNIVQFLGANLSPPCICIVTEYCGRGNLSKVKEKKQNVYLNLAKTNLTLTSELYTVFVGFKMWTRFVLECEAACCSWNELRDELSSFSGSSCCSQRPEVSQHFDCRGLHGQTVRLWAFQNNQRLLAQQLRRILELVRKHILFPFFLSSFFTYWWTHLFVFIRVCFSLRCAPEVLLRNDPFSRAADV